LLVVLNLVALLSTVKTVLIFVF